VVDSVNSIMRYKGILVYKTPSHSYTTTDLFERHTIHLLEGSPDIAGEVGAESSLVGFGAWVGPAGNGLNSFA
jgi:hypothetical protein